MAYVLSQLPVHCSPVKLLKEPDVIPTFKYFFERELGSTKSEDQNTTSNNSVQLEADVDEVIDVVTCEDHNTASDSSVQLKVGVDEVNDVTCEDHNTKSDSSLQSTLDKDEVINVVTCEDHNTKSDSSLQLTLDKDEVINVVTCEDSTETVLLPNVAGASLKRKPEMKEFTIPMKKLRVAKNCLNKKIELEEDEYIFCSKCDKLQIGACSIHCSLQWMKEPSTVLVTEGLTKARATIPDNMELKSSSIPDAGLGIFSKESFESDVVFGPYWGQKIGVADVSPNMDQGYMWDIIENGQVTHVVDARDESHSNWLRFVNCARNEDEQNLVAFQYRGEIYYRSYKVIEPGMEFLVWYGDRYACDLDILDKDNKPADGPIQCQKCFMVCWGPNSLASHNKFRCQMNNENHLWRCMHCDRSFKTQSSLHFHKNIHKGLKPFPCKICGKVFSYPQSRRRHYNQHFGREPVSCKMCRKVFIDKISLRVHIRKYHNHQDLSIQAYKCQYCGQSFMSGVGLSNHMRIHETTNSQYFCSICKVTFGYSFTFAKHMRRKHPGVKVLRCGKCGKVCADKRRLALHVAIKHSRKHGTGSSLQQVKENRSLQHSKKRVSSCNKCKQTLPRNKFHNHMCIQQHTNVNTVGEQGVDSKKPINSSGKKRENSVNLPKDRFVGQNNAIKCDFCFKCFPTLYLMYHHRAAHFRKNNPALPASVNTVAEQRVVSKKPGNSSDQKHEDSPSLLKDRLVGQNTTVRCEFCLKGFPTSHLMHRHRAAHFRKSNPTFPIAASIRPTVPPSERLDHAEHSSKEIRCKVCCKKFPSLEKLQCHRAIHFSGIGKFCCTICGRSFKTKRSLGSHKTHHSINRRASGSCDGSFRCEICSKSFPTERSLRSHKSHHGRPRGDGDALLSPSPKCPQETKGSQGVDTGSKELFGRNVHKKHLPSSLSVKEPQHRSSNHPSNESAFSTSEHKLFRCEVCGKKFRVKATLQRHKGHHTRAKHFRAHQFAKANFKSKSSVGGNVPKPYECNTCLESFCSRGSLLVHKRRADHGMNATLICPFCDKTFSSKENLLVHKQQLHSTADPFMCLCCNAQFSTKYARNKHVIVCRVEEEKRETTVNPEASFKSSPTVDESCQEPHVCNICFESFQSIRSLSGHKRLHAGISTPCVCSICHRGLSSKRSLLRHKMSQHSTTSLHCKDELAAKRNGSNHSCITQMKTTKCHLCSEAFLTTPGLLKHLALKHGIGESVQKNSSSPKTHQQKSDALGVSPFSCLPCNKRFLSYNGLYKHNRNHHSERKHDSAQTVQSSVDADLDGQQGCKPESTDKGIRQFACLPCNKRFLSYSGLYRHDRKRHAKSKSDAAKRVKINLDQQGLERNETNNYRRWKCQYCEKEFQSYSGFNKHVRKKHRKKNRLDRRQGCKADAKGINRPFKCQYCEKQFWTNSGMKKHVWRKHPTCKKKIIDNQQGYKPEVKANIDASSSETIKATLTCHHCKISGSQSSRLNCCRCNTELSVQSRISLDSSPSMESSKPAMRTFRCQYCLKGFSTINSRYKHIVIAHETELISIPPAPRKTLGNGHNNTINAASLAGQSKEAVQNCQKVHGSASDDNHQLQEAKSKPIKKVMRGRAKRCRFTFSCWYCRRSFLSNTSRRKHELIVHEQRVGFSSALLKCNNGKIYKGKPSSNTAILSEEQLPAGQNRQGEPLASSSTDGSHAKMVSDAKLPPTSKAFPCQYCPRQFFSVSGRYKHVALAHSEKASSSSKVCQLHPKVPNECNVSSVSPAKRAKPLSINSGEPLSKRSKPQEMGPVVGLTLQNDITSGCRDAVSSSSKQTLTRIKAFQCKYCTKSFSACSLRYKHFLLVHSRSRALAEQGSVDQGMCFVDKPSQASLPHATSNDSVSIVKPNTSSFVSQSKIREPNRLSVPDNCSKVVSVFDEDLEPYTCKICSKFFRTKSDWVVHFKEEHNNAGKAMSGIRSPSRPALRTISPAFHNNSLKPLRNRRKTRTKAKHGNQVSSLCERNVAKPKSSVCPLGTKANIPDKRAQCDICLLFFSTRDSVSRHKKTKHCDERPFQCHFCGFAAKRSDHISSHERYHCKGRI